MPKAARSLLDYRYYQLENSIKLAAAHGYKGSKYAYQNDIVGYNNVYWNTISPLQIFNTGLISISAWNYYRVTRDYDWLYKKGFEILKNNADFFASKLEAVYVKDQNNNDTTEVNYYNMNNVYSIDGESGNNNSFTNYLAKISLQYALQAKYELNYAYDVDWNLYIDKIVLNVDSVGVGALYNIIKTNDDDINLSSQIDFLEPLLILHPYYSKFFFTIPNSTNGSPIYDVYTTKNNLDLYSNTRLNSSYSQNSFNKLLIATLYARIAQQETTTSDKTLAIEKFNENMLEFFENSTLQPWGSFYNSQYTKTYNDIGVSSMFILGILTSIIGLKITGKVDSDRNYFEELGITSETAGIMPKTWGTLEIYGIREDSGGISGLGALVMGTSGVSHYCLTNMIVYTP
jgi:trehalose/maltose hydrolase-like predicted phosphorylase